MSERRKKGTISLDEALSTDPNAPMSEWPAWKAWVGALVEVEYKKQSGNYRWYIWKMTAVYLGQTPEDMNFSLRPVMGSTSLSKRWSPIHWAELVMSRDEVQKFGGVRSRSLEGYIKLPHRSPGAVEPPPGL